MSDTWKRWEGQTVDGKFPLLQYLSGSEHSAVFLTECRVGERLVEAAIKVIHADSTDGEVELSHWQEAAKISHPHLISLYETGRFEFDGKSLVYVVMECAQENLAQVIGERALTAAETRTMLEAILQVLAYLHGRGFVHGQIRPTNIMATGDELKLSSDCLRRVGESLGGPVYQTTYDPPEYARGVVPGPQMFSAASDIWSLGVTLVEALTQSLPVVRTAEQLDPLIPTSLQEPFLDIARHCLLRRPEGRWTAAQVAARLVNHSPALPSPDPGSETHAPARGVLPISPRSGRPAKLFGYAAAIAIGFVLLLVAILAVPRLLRHDATAPPLPGGGSEQPIVSSASSQVAASQAELPPQEPPAGAHDSRLAEREQPSEAPTATPALAHPETTHEEEANATAIATTGASVHGEVAHQVMPEVLQSARNTIRGTVRVSVRVHIDRAGNVERAELESRGPSKYFARAALDAARMWKFKPPVVDGQGVLSSWTLQFEFTRGETKIVPLQKMP